jgi:hypothetical protein
VSQYLRNRGLAAKQYRMVNRNAPPDSSGKKLHGDKSIVLRIPNERVIHSFGIGAPEISISELYARPISDELSLMHNLYSAAGIPNSGLFLRTFAGQESYREGHSSTTTPKSFSC